ncbi:MAG: GDSL-type esterase/lipase family protein, partial [Clostridia bacterium]
SIGVLIFIIIVILIIFHYYAHSKVDRVLDFKVFNKYAPENPIVFLGDSLTEFYHIHEFFHINKLCNRGISGETTLDVLKRIDDVTCLNPSALFLQIGINDILYNKKVTATEVLDHIDAIVKCFDKNKTKIYITSLSPLNTTQFISKVLARHANNKRIQEVNTILKNYCYNNNITYIDIYSHLCDENGNLVRSYSIEGLHFAASGYSVATKILKPYVYDALNISLLQNRK